MLMLDAYIITVVLSSIFSQMEKEISQKLCKSARVPPTFLDSFKYKKAESANSEMMTQPNSDSDDELLAICVNGKHDVC